MIELFKNLMFVAGGVVLGYFLAQVRLEAKFIDKVDYEINEAKKSYQKKYDDLVARDAELVTKAAESMTQYAAAKKDVEEVVERPKPEETRKIQVTGGKKDLVAPTPSKTNYNHISTPPKVSTDSEEAEASEEEDEEGIDVEFISKEDFVADQFGYKQFMFTYWVGDDILSNEKDQPLLGAAREGSVGLDALTKLKDGGVDVGNVYVRNRSGKWEFEIVPVEDKYEESIGPVDVYKDVQVDATE